MAKKARGRKKTRGKRGAAENGTEADRTQGRRAGATQEVAARALRRLDTLEYFILLAALVLALGGGALVAWIFASSLGFSFRIGWAVASLLLFIVPGGTVYLRELRREKNREKPDRISEPKDLHG